MIYSLLLIILNVEHLLIGIVGEGTFPLLNNLLRSDPESAGGRLDLFGVRKLLSVWCMGLERFYFPY